MSPSLRDLFRLGSSADGEPDAPQRPPARIGHPGIDLREEAQLELLRELEDERYQELFHAIRADPAINPGLDGVSYAGRALVHNGYFPTPDAELYAALIAKSRPSAVVEVGSGFSTLVARAALRAAGLDASLHVIDPEPRTEVGGAADTVELEPVERSSLVRTGVAPGTLLFIDSSHRLEPGGDLPFLYAQLLPALPPGVLVHVHDVFTPFDYPAVYHDWGYGEQYLLQALLAGSRALEVVFGCYHMSHAHPEQMRRTFGPEAAGGLFRGASFWMRSIA